MTEVLSALVEIVGQDHVLSEDDLMAPYLTDWRRQFDSRATAVVRPADTQEVSAVVVLCMRHGVGIVPIGGNTGLVGGAVAKDGQILLSLERLSSIRSVDPLGATITVDSGCILRDVQDAAARYDMLVPLSLSAEGRCQIGGNISTGAGGLNVVRYGTVRDQVLGLEVVLPDGRVLDAMRSLRKDTAGYDLKQLFIGAEGTLGIVTGAVLRLFPAPERQVTLWIATATLDAVLELFQQVRKAFGNLLTAFEYLSGSTVQVISEYLGQSPPLAASAESHSVLIELAGSVSELTDESVLDRFAAWQDDGLVDASVMATDERKRDAIWRLRHSASDAQKLAGTCIKHDIGLPTSSISEFVRRIPAELRKEVSEFQLFVFGHIGDGNLHFTVAQDRHSKSHDIEPKRHWINETVHSLVVRLGGTISAEHGIGLLKRDALGRQIGDVGLSLMREVKRQFDPDGLMNPGKML
ncbi:MAG: FAD-binding oxidoreductase [Pseudomonadota bacterium]